MKPSDEVWAEITETFPVSHNDLPEECLSIYTGGFFHVEFMQHDFGVWVILSARHGSTETGRINLGTIKSVNEARLLTNLLRLFQENDKILVQA